jgi:hypothetical protein
MISFSTNNRELTAVPQCKLAIKSPNWFRGRQLIIIFLEICSKFSFIITLIINFSFPKKKLQREN